MEDNIPVISVLQAALLYLWIVPILAGAEKVPMRLSVKDCSQKFRGPAKISSHVDSLFARRILDRECLVRERGAFYGYYFGEIERVRVVGWPDIYRIRDPVPDDLRSVLEAVLVPIP